MKQYKISLTEHAINSLQEIYDYVAYELQVPETADALLSTLKGAISKLDFFPERVVLTDEKHWSNQKIHRLVVKNYLVYFWIDESADVVHIIDIVYSRRDQKRIVQRIPLQ